MDTFETPDRPISVLLVGQKWYAMSAVLRTLSNSEKILVVGRATGSIEAVVAETRPSLILASPDFGYSQVTKMRRSDEAQDLQPPLLLCITHDDLDTEESYEDVDDLVVIPCSAAELDWRMRRLAAVRRLSLSSALLRVGKVVLDLSAHHVTADGRTVDLSWTEFQLLRFLMQNPGRVFSRDHLLATVWGTQNNVGTRTVDINIHRLRHKLGTAGEAFIRTVKKAGYGLVESK